MRLPLRGPEGSHMHDFRVNIKRQEIVLIVAHQPTGAEQLFNKLSPSLSGAAALGFFSKGAQQSGVRGGWWGPRGSRSSALSLL